MINYGLDVTAPDRENMKPADWADATGQHSCTHYLLMVELCWQLSRDVSILTRDIEMYLYIRYYSIFISVGELREINCMMIYF